ncbi:MAG: hypothetical protein OXU75_16340 [Deltaproteobacteria bacterium]|nr:hypothetical protein [Deltaproteobacteria bacterium]
MRNRTDVVIGVLLVTLLSWAVWEAQQWPARTRFFPLAIGYPVLAMAVMHLAYSLWLGLRPLRFAQGPAAPEPAAEAGIVVEPAVVRRRTLEISFWAVTFAVGLYLLGFKVGGLIIPTIFLRYQANELWRTSLLYSLGVYVFFKIGLEEALSFPLPAGQIAFGLGLYSFDSYLIDPVLNLFR